LIVTTLTNKQIQEVICYWVDVLRLRDWNISWALRAMDDMEKAYARISWQMTKGTAHISLSDPKSWGQTTEAQDQEVSIVHELVHLSTAGMCDRLEPIFTKQEDDIFVERPTERISQGMVDLRRNGGHKFSWEKRKARNKKDLTPDPE